MVTPIEAKVRRSRTRLVLAITASFLLVGAGQESLAENEPAARAPLPPLLPSTVSKLRAPQAHGQASALAPKRSQTNADPSAVRVDRSTTRVLWHKHTSPATLHHGTFAAGAGGRADRPREVLVKKAPPHRSGHGVAYNGSPQRNRSQAGHLSPPNEYPGSPSDSAAAASTGPLAGPVSRYYSSPGPPISDFGPGYSPYPWPPPNPGFYR